VRFAQKRKWPVLARLATMPRSARACSSARGSTCAFFDERQVDGEWPDRVEAYFAISEEADHETSSDRQWAACDNWCRLCSLRLLLSVSAAEAKSPASRPGFLLPGNSVARLISMPIEIVLDNAAIIQYSSKYGKDRCRRGSCRARPG